MYFLPFCDWYQILIAYNSLFCLRLRIKLNRKILIPIPTKIIVLPSQSKQLGEQGLQKRSQKCSKHQKQQLLLYDILDIKATLAESIKLAQTKD